MPRWRILANSGMAEERTPLFRTVLLFGEMSAPFGIHFLQLLSAELFERSVLGSGSIWE
jgi:hypothetical protein